ncbi:unnamed protein product [Mytilus edulis]|uniref:DUF7789 domain-containing protein n=1 Tax=Mytilus edulis TaxID=6550 RepID=A0A8S3SND3_MYTED|nr:unnamed protein product [Mytilus edulis]
MDNQDAPITFADIGITKTPQLADTRLGKRRVFKDINKQEIGFSTVACVSLVAALVLAIVKIVELAKDQNTKDPDFTFALIVIINTIFCLYYVLNGILAERPYEILVFVLANIIVWIYVIANYAISPGDIKLVRLVLACILSPILIVLGVLIAKLYNDSGKLIFRTVGANTEQQAMCKTMFAFFGLLKFDLQLGLSMVVLILTNGTKTDTQDIVILSVGPVYTVICFLLGYLSTGENINDGNLALAATTFTCAALALIIRISVAIFAVRTYLNFGYGLSEKVFPMSKHRSVTDGSKDIQDSPKRHSEEGLKQDDR